MSRSITISSPGRIHFGLFSTTLFGGAGLMIDAGRTTLELEPANELTIRSNNPEVMLRIAQTVERWFDVFYSGSLKLATQLPTAISVQAVPLTHSGLGSGTQLTLSVALGLFKFFDMPTPSPAEIALAMNRGKRSAIGSYGFFHGGMLVDRGRLNDEALAPLDFQTDFPDWPVVLFRGKASSGLSGATETSTFSTINPTPETTRLEMVHLVRDKMVPGVTRQNFEKFSRALYELGNRSGMFYKDIQGGAYNGPFATNVVKQVRDFGLDGVGQSSWGPTMFAFAPNFDIAQSLVQEMSDELKEHYSIEIATADNRGAIVTSKTLPAKNLI